METKKLFVSLTILYRKWMVVYGDVLSYLKLNLYFCIQNMEKTENGKK